MHLICWNRCWATNWTRRLESPWSPWEKPRPISIRYLLVNSHTSLQGLSRTETLGQAWCSHNTAVPQDDVCQLAEALSIQQKTSWLLVLLNPSLKVEEFEASESYNQLMPFEKILFEMYHCAMASFLFKLRSVSSLILWKSQDERAHRKSRAKP